MKAIQINVLTVILNFSMIQQQRTAFSAEITCQAVFNAKIPPVVQSVSLDSLLIQHLIAKYAKILWTAVVGVSQL